MESVKLQLVTNRRQLVNLPIPAQIETFLLIDGTHIEEENSGVDDEHVIQQDSEHLPQVVHVLEDESERTRSKQDDVPIQMKSIRNGSLSQIRDDLGAAEH